MIKNNIIRLLESRGIEYSAFELPAEKLSGMEAAAYLGVNPEKVYKTIVITRPKPGKSVLALVPAPLEVDLKGLSKALGEKKVYLATQREAEHITGLEVGGISPLALLNKGFQVVIDDAAQLEGKIYISGGQRGINICLHFEDLAKLTNATFAPISRE